MTGLAWQDPGSDDEPCRPHRFDERWPNGFVCPQCQGTHYWTAQRTGRRAPVYECTACRHQISGTAGTIFPRIQVALWVWFVAMFLIAVAKGGRSVLALSRELGVLAATVQFMHHKIQHALAERNGHDQLGGSVELDAAYFGEVSHGPGKRGRRTDQDLGGSLTEPGHPQYTFLAAVPDLTEESVKGVLEARGRQRGVVHRRGADGRHAAQGPQADQ